MAVEDTSRELLLELTTRRLSQNMYPPGETALRGEGLPLLLHTRRCWAPFLPAPGLISGGL